MPEKEANARSIRALFDLPRYDLLHIKRWAGWCEISIVPKTTWFRCPKCRTTMGPGQPFRWRPLRDLDITQRHVILRVQTYRIQCPPCGRPVLPCTLARTYARCTRRLERRLFELTGDSTVKAVAKRMALDWETVKDAEVRYIRGLLRKRMLDGVTHIGIDEVSYQKRHKYLTLVTDLNSHRVIYATHHNDGAAIRRFLKWFGPKRCRRIKVVVTDMHDAYTSALRKALPRAVLVYDHFHVSKIVHDALDNIRRRIQRQLPPDERRIIKGQRYVLLTAAERLKKREQVSLQEILALNTDLTAGHILKEGFRHVFHATNLKEARRRLKEWKTQVRESGVPELIDVLKTIKRRRRGIENFFRTRASNGMAEGFNNVVGTIKKQAYGFHDREYLMLKILRVCGKLE